MSLLSPEILSPPPPPGVSRAASPVPRWLYSTAPATGYGDIILENSAAGAGGDGFMVFKSPFSFTSSETSQVFMERILSHSQDASPRTPGRLSHSSAGALTDTPPFSPAEIADDLKVSRSNFPANPRLRASINGTPPVSGAGKTVGRWLKERKEKRKEETRVQNAQLHAAVTVAGVAAAIAAVASANARNDAPKTDLAMASAATLVAAQCVEAAEAMGADHEQLATVISSAVNVKSAGDIMTLTAAAATALRGAATLKSRALRDIFAPAPVISPEKVIRASSTNSYLGSFSNAVDHVWSRELIAGDGISGDGSRGSNRESFSGDGNRGFLESGSELLKRTRNGDLHWKIVSVYINGVNQVVLKMKSKHVAGTIVKKKKNMVVDVINNIPAWPGRHLLDSGGERRYFGLKTTMRGVVEFECRNQREYDIWTQGVSKLLAMAEESSYVQFRV